MRAGRTGMDSRSISRRSPYTRLSTPPERSADIYDKGIVISGGGAQLRNIDRYVNYQTGIPAIVAENPQTCVPTGTGLALEGLEGVGWGRLRDLHRTAS